MTNREIIPLIYGYQNNSMKGFDVLYSEFYNLLVYYGRKIDGEDTVQELTIFFMNLLFDIKTDRFYLDSSCAVQRYIAVAIRNKYIALSKQFQELNNYSEELYDWLATNDDNLDDKIMLRAAISLLSKQQRSVILLKYFYNYTDVEIAAYLHITRQAVNRLKNRALFIMKKYFLN